MTELFGSLLNPRPESAANNHGDGPLKPSVKDMVTGLISDNLQRLWVEEEPGEKCFDHDESRMGSLLSFIDGKGIQSENDEVRGHLLQCPRCRFIYAQLRGLKFEAKPSAEPKPETTRSTGEPIPDLLRDNLRSTGPVVFPGQEVSEGAWEFGLLGDIPADVAERICEAVAERSWRRLRGVLPKRGVVIVCFGNPVHRCGKRMAAKMVDSGVEDVHVVMADNFFNPKLWCNPRELKEHHVVVFVDVVHSGGLLNRLFAVCRQGEPSNLMGVAIIDQSRSDVADEPLYSLWAEPKEKRDHHDGEAGGQARFFDPVTGRAWPREDLPNEVADPDKAKDTIESRLREIRPLFRYIESTGALKQDAWIGGVCYPWALDLLCLLRHDEARGELAKRAANRLADLSDRDSWCIVFPAERHQRAGAWAELLAETLHWPVVKVGLKNRMHYRPLTKAQRRDLAKYPRALIVDAAIRSGKTLQSLVGILRAEERLSIKEFLAFYALDGLFNEPREELEKNLKVKIRSLFRLPLGAPTEPVGRYCRQWLNQTLGELDQVANGEHAPWIDVVRDYCQRKLEHSGRPVRERSSEELEMSLRRALDEGERGAQARLEQSCDPPRSSLVKHLDVAYTLREPQTRNVLHGFMCNSMPLDFIESCALALATQKDYDWFDRDWLALHKKILTNSASQRWKFLAYISYWIRRHGSPKQVERIRATVDSFRRSQGPVTVPMFADMQLESDEREVLQSRCKILLSVLS